MSGHIDTLGNDTVEMSSTTWVSRRTVIVKGDRAVSLDYVDRDLGNPY